MGVNRVVRLAVKELLELKQDPRLFGIVIMAPLVQLGVLGYAATTDVKDVPILIVDTDRSAESRTLISRFEASSNFRIAGSGSSTNDIDRWLDSGDAWLALTIPPDYGRRIQAGLPVALQVVADGTDANSTTVALGYTRSLVAGYAAELAADALGPAAAAPVSLETEVWFNPRLESRDFMIPGIMALLLLVVTTNLSAMAIVREKEIGTLEQLNVTPLARWELITGKLIPYGLIGIVDVVLVLLVAIYWFQVPMRGSVPLLFAMSLIYLLSTLGLGLFVSSISNTQQQAMLTTVFFFMMPMIYLSGFVFPIENMPGWIAALTYLVPLRYFLTIVRGIFLKGVGFDVLWPQAAALLAWALSVLVLATLRSSKRLS
ncbi:MAG TPA: ABC transporter permease [Vicinamibacterales bacterium]|jgi:ABC-2 type transport system permease protein|nr:ABC transporter permease [Vicinamibacterales bacterium]